MNPRAFILALLLFPGLLAAEPPTVLEGGDYLCQTLLVRLPVEVARTLAGTTEDPWPLATDCLASGQAALVSAPSVVTKSGMKVTSEGKTSRLEVALNAMKPGRCYVQISFKSKGLTFTTDGDLDLAIGSGRILAQADAPDDSTQKLMLLFRTLTPLSSAGKN